MWFIKVVGEPCVRIVGSEETLETPDLSSTQEQKHLLIFQHACGVINLHKMVTILRGTCWVILRIDRGTSEMV